MASPYPAHIGKEIYEDGRTKHAYVQSAEKATKEPGCSTRAGRLVYMPVLRNFELRETWGKDASKVVRSLQTINSLY